MRQPISYRLARATYRWRWMPCKVLVRDWYAVSELKRQVRIVNKGKPRIKWWQREVYVLGMWLNRCGDGLTGDWLVHRVPYDVRFKLA